MKKGKIISLIILFSFSLISGFGYLGSNVDVCAYQRNPNSIWRISEFIGGSLATLTYGSIFLGQFVSATLLIFSIYFLVNEILKKLSYFNKSYLLTLKHREIYSVLISSITVLVWPFYPYLTNALRQSISLSFSALLITILISDNLRFKRLLIFFTSFIIFFSHKSGYLLLAALISSHIQIFIIENIDFKLNKKLIYLTSSIIGNIFIISLSGILKHGIEHVPGLDLGIPLLIIAITYGAIFLVKLDYKKTIFPKIIYQSSLFSALSIAFTFQNGFTVERLFPYFLIIILPIIAEILILYIKQTITTILILSILGINVTVFSGQYLDTYKVSTNFGRLCSKLN